MTFLKALGVFAVVSFVFFWCLPGSINLFQPPGFEWMFGIGFFGLPMVAIIVIWNAPGWRWRGRLMIASVVLTNLLSIFAVASLEEHWFVRHIKNNGIETTGHVSGVRFRNGYRDTASGIEVVCQFELGENTFYTSSYHFDYGEMKRGDTVVILYLPDHPERCILIE